MYKRLYSEHLQLERAFGLLRHLVAESHGQERTAKILSWAEEKQKLQNIVESLKMVVGQLKQELKEAQDQNELLEFRFLELEQCQFKVTEDEQLREKGVNTDSCIENQDILDFDDVIKKCEATNTKKLEDKCIKQLLEENKLLKETIIKLKTYSARVNEFKVEEVPVFSDPHNQVFPDVEKEWLKQQYTEVCKAYNYLKDKLQKYERLNNELVGKLAAVEKSKQELEENNLQLHIDYVSAREHVQKLLQLDHRPCLHSTSDAKFRIDKSEDVSEEPYSLGTATSEDEGLGDDSRKGDSTGPSSLADLHETEEDLLTKSSEFNFAEEYVMEHSDLKINLHTSQEFQQMRSEFGEMNNLRCKENQLSEHRNHSNIFFMELNEKLEVEKDQVCKIQSGNCISHHNSCDEINKWEMEIEKQQARFEEDKMRLQTALVATQVEKHQLKPQPLEPEEVENDDRYREEKLQEQINSLFKKHESLKEDLSEKNMNSEIAIKQFRATEPSKSELRSQITHMEALLQNFKVDIRNLEASETELREKVFKLEQSLFHLLSAATHQNCDCLMRSGTFQLVKTINPDVKMSCEKSSVEVQVDVSPFDNSRMVLEKFTQTLEDFRAKFDACYHNPAINTIHKISKPSLCFFSEVKYEKQRDSLFHIKQKDSILKVQPYQLDGLLWKKLHDLENHVGTCKKNNINSVIVSLPFLNGPEEKEQKTPLCLNLLTIGKYDTFDKEMQISLPFQLQIIPVTANGILQQRCEYFLSAMLSLDSGQERLEERFCKQERMKYEYEKELERKEIFHKERVMQQQKWKLEEMLPQKNIQMLNREKPLFLEKASSSDLENLERNVKWIQKTFQDLKIKHTRELEDLEHVRNHAVANLSHKIKGLEKTIEKMKDQVTKYKEEAKIINNELIQQITGISHHVIFPRIAETRNDEQNCFEEQVRQKKHRLEKLKEAHKSQPELLKSERFGNESKLEKELIELRFQNQNLDDKVALLHEKYMELEKKITFKSSDLELCDQKYKYSMKLLEEEHHTVEAKLKWRTKEMEDYIKTYVTALKEEKENLQVSLQNALDDLHFKEGYEFRISELEKQIVDLKTKNDNVTEDVYSFKVPNAQTKKNAEKYHLRDMEDTRIRELESIEADLRLEVTRLRQCLSASNSHLEDLDCVRRNQEHTITRLEKDKISLQDELLQLRASSGKSQELFDRIVQLEEDKIKLLKRIETMDIEEEWREGLRNVNAQLQQQVELLQEQITDLNEQINDTKVLEDNEPEPSGENVSHQRSETDVAELDQQLQLQQELIIGRLQTTNGELEAKESGDLVLEGKKEMYDVGTMTEDSELKSGSLHRSTQTVSKEPAPSTNSHPKRLTMRKAETIETLRHNVKCISTSYDTSGVASSHLNVSDIGSFEELDAPFHFGECVTSAMLVMENKLENKEHLETFERKFLPSDTSPLCNNTESTRRYASLFTTYFLPAFDTFKKLYSEKSTDIPNLLTSETTKPLSMCRRSSRDKIFMVDELQSVRGSDPTKALSLSASKPSPVSFIS